MSFITTYTKKYFDPLNVDESLLDIKDIAHALSLICRGNGHVQYFYSVAQHSLACAKEAKTRGYSKEVILGCLLHDGSEVYLSDVTRPIKKELTYYLEVEDVLQNVIWKHFIQRDLTKEETKLVFEIDDENQFKEQIDRYKEKYRNIFSFNTSDTYDVTPYFTFTDDKLSLVGNVRGYVVIGNTLKMPENNTPTYDVDDEIAMAAAPGPIEPGFKGFKGASLSIKNGKYRSTMTIGRIVNGNSFAV